MGNSTKVYIFGILSAILAFIIFMTYINSSIYKYFASEEVTMMENNEVVKRNEITFKYPDKLKNFTWYLVGDKVIVTKGNNIIYPKNFRGEIPDKEFKVKDGESFITDISGDEFIFSLKEAWKHD